MTKPPSPYSSWFDYNSALRSARIVREASPSLFELIGTCDLAGGAGQTPPSRTNGLLSFAFGESLSVWRHQRSPPEWTTS
jgi:hypothetical protein